MKRLGLTGLLCACAVACATEVPPPEPPPRFSGEQAFGHLEQLVGLGPRVAATPQGQAARGYVRAQLEAMELPVHEEPFHWAPTPDDPERAFANLWTEVRGTRAGMFVVATPLDTNPKAGVGANEGGSGAALLLELARVLREAPLPYTVRLLFLDAELLDAETAFLGSEHAYLAFESGKLLGELRAWVYLHQVGDRDLEIRRDRSSDRGVRDAFFEAARREGLGAAFPAHAPFDDSAFGEDVLVAHRFPRVVALVDTRYGGPDSPGPLWRTDGDALSACSSESLGAVGRVTLEGLRILAKRQQVLDEAMGAAP